MVFRTELTIKYKFLGGCVKSSEIELNYKFSSAPKLINQGIGSVEFAIPPEKLTFYTASL